MGKKEILRIAMCGLPVVGVPCTLPDEDRNCPYCNTPMEEQIYAGSIQIRHCIKQVNSQITIN